jgi:hypothetical protein
LIDFPSQTASPPIAESILSDFNTLRRHFRVVVTPKLELRNDAEPHDLMPQGAMRSIASRRMFQLVASWNIPFDKLRAGFRGRFAAP